MVGTDLTPYSFRVFWSAEDAEWVAVCEQMPSLSCLNRDMVAAMEGVQSIVADYVDEQEDDVRRG